MSSFFNQTAQAMIAKHIDRYPMLKLHAVLDWHWVEAYLQQEKSPINRNIGGRPAYSPLSMFKAILLGQWHSLSDPELEHSLITRIDFLIFCGFDEMNIPDHTTLCRFRNWLAEGDRLAKLLDIINEQLVANHLKIKKGTGAVIDATLIQTAASVQRKAVENKADGTVAETPSSKDKDARWTKKKGKYLLGYKENVRTDKEGYIEKLTVCPANEHDSRHFEALLEGVEAWTAVYADKGYDSRKNRKLLKDRKLDNGIMRKAQRNRALTAEEKWHNKHLAKTRYVVEQSFGTLHRKFRLSRARYFGLKRVLGQCHLKGICLNLLKAANKITFNKEGWQARLFAPIFA